MTGRDEQEDAAPLERESLASADELHPDEDTEEEDAPRYQEAVVAFRLSGQWLGLPAHHVSQIADWEEPSWLPRAPAHVLGLMNLAGYPVPVVDLLSLLGLRGDAGPSDTDQFFERIVVAQALEMRVGFRAEQVMGVVDAGTAILQPVQATQSPELTRFALGELDYEDTVVTVLDLPVLLERARVRG